jgi:1-deoxy-D-xylulose-5-phosphate synthase
MFTAQLPREGKAFTIRYPRGQGVMTEWRTQMGEMKIGKGVKLRNGDEVMILTVGHIGNYAIEVCEKLERQNIKVGHCNMRFIKPLDERLLHEVCSKYKKIITVEDGCIQGGFGSAVLEFMADNQYSAEVKRLGIPDNIIEHGEQFELHRECNFDPEGIEKAVLQLLAVSKAH